MNRISSVAKRELGRLFYSPIAYAVLGLFGLGTTLFFLYTFGPGQPATLRPTLGVVIWLMILLVPAISMGLISEEYRSGSIEALMTTPLSDTQVIIGKWAGATGFFAFLLIPVGVLVGVLEINADPEWGPIVSQLLGLMLVGGLYLAIGTFASAVTENQIIAFLLTVFLIFIITVGMNMLPQFWFVPGWMRHAMIYINVNRQFEAFNKGVIDLSNLVYFVSGIGVFLFLGVKVLESRRWR